MSKKRNREGPTYEEAVKAVCMRELRAEELTDSETLSLTPLDEQIYHLRCALPHDVLLLVTCGYKVKVLGRDSRVVSRRTGIMSIRCKPYESSSFPVQRLPHYVGRLVDMGYQVAFADQVETAAVRATSKGSSGSTAQKKVFERRVTAVYCRGTTSAASLASLSAAPQSGDSSAAAAGVGDEDEEEPLQSEAAEEPMGKMDTLKADVSPRYVLFLWNKKNSGCSPTSSRSGEAESWEVSLLSLVSLVRCDVPPFAHPRDAITALQEIMSVLEPCQIVCTSNHLAGVQDLLAQLTVAHAYHCGPTDEGSEDHVTASISGSYASCPSLSALIDQFLLRFLVWKEGTPRIEWSRVALGELLRASHRCAILPVTTQRALHVFHDDVRQHASTVSSTTSGMTLLRFLDHCRTVGGSRLLRRWIASPLTDYSELQDRQRAVEAFASSNSSSGIGEETTRYLERCFALLRTSADPQATLARLRLAQCTVGELTGFVQLLLRLSQVAVASETDRRGISTSSLSDPVVAQCALLRDTFQQIEAADVPRLCHALAEEMNLEATKPQTVFEGVKKPPSSIEPLHAERELALDQLEQLLQRARKDMKMPSLEYSTVSGVPYLFDLKQTSSSSIPPDWTVVSRTKSSVRYQSSDVQHWYTKLCAANDKIAAACEVEWIAMQHRLSQEHAVSLVAVKRFLEAFAVLDVLRHAFARLARLPMYVKPTLLVADDDANAAICIRQGRHPLAESMLKAVGRTYVASDVVMQPHGTWLLTGPNMGGKSALMRMVGLMVLLAQLGCSVPAESCTLPIFHGVYCRMGSEDALLASQSTFFVELDETRTILTSPALAQSLVLMDELGQGTSSFDGMAVASATLRYLIAHRATTVFVTHHTVLCDPYREGQVPSVSCWYMAFCYARSNPSADPESPKTDQSAANQQAEGRHQATIQFLHHPVQGVTPSSFGVEVASMALLPSVVTKRAAEKSAEAEADQRVRVGLRVLRHFV